MPFPRASAVRGAFRAAQSSKPTIAKPQAWRQISRRGYASHGGHESAKAASDIPWAIGAIAVTVPSCWYLLSNAPEEAHGGLKHPHKPHGSSHGHEEEHEEKDEGEETKEEPESKEDSEEGDKATEKSEDSDDSDTGDEGKDTPDTSDDEDSEKEGESKEDKSKDDPKPKAAGPAGDDKSQSGKQEGVSNTDTKHPKISSKDSKKADGDDKPSSAKAKGTVDSKKS